jgi:hypothetical protein
MAANSDAAGEGVLDLDRLNAAQWQRLNEVASEIAADFNAVIASLYRGAEDNVPWLLSSCLSRNSHQSTLFETCCALVLAIDLARREGKIREVRTSNRALARTLRDWARATSHPATVVCTEIWRARIRRWLGPWLLHAHNALWLGLRCLGRRRNALKNFALDRPILLIDTFVLNTAGAGSVTNGEYRDRYYPGLLDALTSDEKERSYLFPTLIGFRNPYSVMQRMRQVQPRFLIPDDFLRISDYAFSLFGAVGAMFHRTNDACLRGIDLSKILRAERWWQSCRCSTHVGLLYYRFVERLAECKVRVQLLLDWNENQPIDRGLVRGFRDFLPSAEVVGYRGGILPLDFGLHLSPIPAEIRAGLVPPRMGSFGRAFVHHIKRFAPDLTVDLAPAFRYQHVRGERAASEQGEPAGVLAALPIERKHTRVLLEQLARAAQQLPGVTFVIRPHPSYEEELIRSLIPAWPANFRVAQGSFAEAVLAARVFVTSASSSALEAVALGAPVVVVSERTGLSKNPIPAEVPCDCWALVVDSSELQREIRRFLNLDDAAREQMRGCARKWKEEFFEPVTRAGIRQWLFGQS